MGGKEQLVLVPRLCATREVWRRAVERCCMRRTSVAGRSTMLVRHAMSGSSPAGTMQVL